MSDQTEDFTLVLDPVVDEALQSIYQSTDPLDAPDFDPVVFINEQFPDEEAMTRLNSYSEELAEQIQGLEDQILQTVREQSQVGRSAEADINEAKQTISDLFGRIVEIKEKAVHSEELVQVICKNISKLDTAKRNLTESLNALARLQMFISSLDAAEALKDTRQYIKAARSMGAVMQLSRYFDKYKDIETIGVLMQRVQILRDAFCTSIFGDFEQVEDLVYTFDGSSSSPITEDMLDTLENEENGFDDQLVTRSRLQAACFVIEAMGVETRNRLITAFCINQLKNYEQLFRPESAGESLEQMERRFHWFWKTLADYEAKYQCLFPYNWHVDAHLLQLFCDRTKEHVQTVLSRYETPEMVDVPVLVSALRTTMQFERELVLKMDLGKNNVPPENFPYELDEEGQIVDSESPAGIRLRYERLRKRVIEEREALKAAEKERIEAEGKEYVNSLDELPSFLGYISGIFDPYLSAFVTSEKTNFTKLLERVIKGDELARGGDLPVLQGAVKLFQYLKETLSRCATMSTGQTLVAMSVEVKTTLLTFQQALEDRLPRMKNRDSFGDECVKFKKTTDRDSVCYCINTAAYIAELVPQLESMTRELADAAVRESIDLQSELVDKCYDTVSLGIKTLVSGEYGKVENLLFTMTSINWSTFQDIGDQSKYVSDISTVLCEEFPSIRNLLSRIYYRNFCDRLAMMFLPRFLDTVTRCKRVNEMAAQQLLLDLHSLKNLFLKLPTINQNETDEFKYVIPPTYFKFVTRAVEKADMMLKLLGTPVTYLAASFHDIMPEGTEEDLVTILTVKGATKQEKTECIDEFREKSEI
ncbi:hypothetical protein WA171_005635 [Blastocystis sp. BT1]